MVILVTTCHRDDDGELAAGGDCCADCGRGDGDINDNY